MATKSNRLVPARVVHPGEILREELRERGIKQKDFAQMIGMQPTHLSEFVNGKRNMNENLAMALERCFGIPFKTWMALHAGYVYDCKIAQTAAVESEHDHVASPKSISRRARDTRRQPAVAVQ